MLHTEWDHPPKQAENCFWILALSRLWSKLWRTCHLMGRTLATGFLDKITFFFNFFYTCAFVFCGECGCICMISICVADDQLWLLWLNDGYQYECWSAIMDYMAHIYMIIICIKAHQHVITDYYHQSVWMFGHICVCLAIGVCKVFFFPLSLFLLQKLFLLYF